MPLLALLLAVASTVDVSGRIKLPGSPASESVILTLRAAGTNAEEIVVTCPVAPNGSLHCKTPVGRFDVRVTISGFTPIYRWDVEFKPPAINLGQFVTQRSSSVAGWVVDGRNRDPVAEATVELLDRGDQPVVRQTTRSNARGFFQFTGLDPGTYGARAKSKGTSTAYVSNIVVRESAETLLDKPIALSPPARLAVSITPAMKAPKKPWRVDLWRQIPMTPYGRMIAEKTADAAGNADFEALDTGSYRVTVRDAAGTVFARETLEIDENPPPLFIRIAAVPIRGRLSTGTAGVKAAIEFSTSRGESLTVQSNERGDFEGLLPREGKWHVDVHLPSRQELNVRLVEIRRRDAEEFARVDLELPPGRLEGRVVDEKGKGVRTGVRLTRGNIPDTATVSGDDGRFAMVGLATGQVVLDAGTTEIESGPVPVTVSENAPPITVTLRRSRKIKGWITTPSGYPVAGATIRYWGEAVILGGETMSSPSGTFEFSLPSNATSIDLLIVAPGVPAKLMRLAVAASDERIHLTTSATPGRLIIRLPWNSPPWPTVSRDGVTTSLMWIIRPSTRGGVRPPGLTPDGMMIEVDPGQYTVCLKDHCSTADVAPGAQVKVDASQ